MSNETKPTSTLRNGVLLIVALAASVGVAVVVGNQQGDAAAPPSPEPAVTGELPADHPPVGAMEAHDDALPPGHPPVDGAAQAGELPPGHPSLDGADQPGEMPAGHPSVAGGHGTITVAPGSIAPAQGKGAVTVAQLFRDAAKHEGNKVRLTAKVTKATPNVLGRTWLHVSDGTGSADHGNHDLVVTTMETPSPGDVVLLEGVVTRDKDLGSGYRYDVLLEDATVHPPL